MGKAEEICGCKSLKQTRRNGSEWWNDEVKELVKWKNEMYGKYLGDRNERRWREYREACGEVKRRVREEKRRASGRGEERESQIILKRIKRCFGKR